MDINSFAYQTAIKQITEQEQGEADKMLAVLEGCWLKVNHYWLWNMLFAVSYSLFLVIIGIIGIFIINEDFN